MDGLLIELPLFLLATFAGALVAGLCVWARRLVDLALHAHALADNDARHRVRADRAGLLGLETSPCTLLAQAPAVPARRRNWRAGRGDDPNLVQSRSTYV